MADALNDPSSTSDGMGVDPGRDVHHVALPAIDVESGPDRWNARPASVGRRHEHPQQGLLARDERHGVPPRLHGLGQVGRRRGSDAAGFEPLSRDAIQPIQYARGPTARTDPCPRP